MRKPCNNEPAFASGGRPRTPLRDAAPGHSDAAGSAFAASIEWLAEAPQSRGDSGSVENAVGSPQLCLLMKKSLAARMRPGETSSAVISQMASEGGRYLPTEPLGALSVGLKWASPQPVLYGLAAWEGGAVCIPGRTAACSWHWVSGAPKLTREVPRVTLPHRSSQCCLPGSSRSRPGTTSGRLRLLPSRGTAHLSTCGAIGRNGVVVDYVVSSEMPSNEGQTTCGFRDSSASCQRMSAAAAVGRRNSVHGKSQCRLTRLKGNRR